MANINFNLKSPNSKGESLIYLIITDGSDRIRVSTGEKVNKKYWNEKKHRVKETREFPQYSEFNALLNKFENEAQNIFREYQIDQKKLTKDNFKKELDIRFGRIEKKNEGLIYFIEELISSRSKSNKFSAGSIKVYKTTLNHLLGYLHKSVNIQFSDFAYREQVKFRDYLYDKEFSENYIHKTLSTLRTFFNEAIQSEIEDVPKISLARLQVRKKDVENVYLTGEELAELHNLDLEGKSRLKRVRDLFLTGALTGLRFSDFSKLKEENIRIIDGREIIDISPEKTGESVLIPLNPIVKKILNENKQLKVISNQKMNEYLKEVVRLAGINDKIRKSYNKGGTIHSDIKEKWELVSSHTARRSFATNAYKAGIPSISIMKITGHNTETAFMRYIQITKEENAVLMADNKFFKGV